MQLEQEYPTGGWSAVEPADSADRRYSSSRLARARLMALAGELVVSRERREDMLILTLSGELDLATSALLERELDDAEAARPTRLIVDLAGLEFIDSSGLKTLVRAHQRASQNGHQLSLRQGPRVVRRMFELTERVQLFSFDD